MPKKLSPYSTQARFYVGAEVGGAIAHPKPEPYPPNVGYSSSKTAFLDVGLVHLAMF